jgi:hypothetical protein
MNMRATIFALVVVYTVFGAISSIACRCGSGYHGQSAWELARAEALGSTVIFEGTPVHFELKWDLPSVKDGELISTNAFSPKDWPDMPHMAVTFHVERRYKGDLGSEVELQTGLGGGDCGADYAPGLSYLVYAAGPSPSQLSVSMCSPGGWIEGAETATDLRYLRKERATSEDLAPNRHPSQAGWAKQDEQRRRKFEESREKYEAATGRICGSLVRSVPRSESRGSLAFLSNLGYSPVADFGEIKDDDSFCSRNLGPGKYYLYFVQTDDDGTSASYYPGVTDVSKATPLEVRAGQTLPNIVFHVAAPSSYSVRGFIFADQKPDFNSNVAGWRPVVVLVRSDGDRRVWFNGDAKFILPKTAYFKIDHVVPGHYFAWVLMPAKDWMARKIEFDVTSHMKFISLDVVHKK